MFLPKLHNRSNASTSPGLILAGSSMRLIQMNAEYPGLFLHYSFFQRFLLVPVRQYLE